MGNWVDRGKQHAELLLAQRRYQDQVNRWLAKHFPDLVGTGGFPHPAAFTAVVNLHGRLGKGRLTRRQHGAEIRAAVERWDAQNAPKQPTSPDLIERFEQGPQPHPRRHAAGPAHAVGTRQRQNTSTARPLPGSR